MLGLIAAGGAAAWYGYFGEEGTPKWFVALGLIWALCAYGISLGYNARSGGFVADTAPMGPSRRSSLTAASIT